MSGELDVRERYSAYPRLDERIPIGPPRLTKYERAKIIGVRALQLASGAPPLVDPRVVGSNDFTRIAEYEVDKGILPASIYRYLPGGGGASIPLRVLLEAEWRLIGRRL